MAADRAKFNELHYNIDDTINSITQAASDLANREAQDVSDINNAIQLLSDTHNKDVQDIRNDISDINNELDECVHIGDKTSLILFDELIGAVDDGTSVIKNGASISTAGDRKTKTDVITVDASKINLNTANLTNTLVSDTGIVFTDASAKKHTVMFDDTTKAITDIINDTVSAEIDARTAATDAINANITNIVNDAENSYVKLGPISSTVGISNVTHKISQSPTAFMSDVIAAAADGSSTQGTLIQSQIGTAIGGGAKTANNTGTAGVTAVVSLDSASVISNTITLANTATKNTVNGTKSINTIKLQNIDGATPQSQLSLEDNIIELKAADAASKTNQTLAFEIGMTLDPAVNDGSFGINTHYRDTRTNTNLGAVATRHDYNAVNSDGSNFKIDAGKEVIVDGELQITTNSNLSVSPTTITTTIKDSTKQAHTESTFNATNATIQVVENTTNKLYWPTSSALSLRLDSSGRAHTNLQAYNASPVVITDGTSVDNVSTNISLGDDLQLRQHRQVTYRDGSFGILSTSVVCSIDESEVDDTIINSSGNPDPFRKAQQISATLWGSGLAGAELIFDRDRLLHGWYENDFTWDKVELDYVYNKYRDLHLLNSLTVKEDPATCQAFWEPSLFVGTVIEGTTGYAGTIFVDARYGKFGYNTDSWQQINNIVSLFIPTRLASKSYGTVTFTLYSAGQVKCSSDEFYRDYPGGTPVTLHYGPEDVWTPTESGSDKLFVQIDFNVGNNYISTIKLEANASIGSEFYVDGNYLSYKKGNSGIYIEPSEYYLKLSDSFTSISIENGCIWAGRGGHWPSLKVSTFSATLAACEGSSDGASLRVRQGDWRNPSCVDMWSNNWWWKRPEGRDVIAYGEFDISINSVYTHFNWGLDLSATGTYNSNPIYGQVHLGVHHTHEVLNYTSNTSATASLQNGSNNYVRVGDDYVSLKCFNGFGVSTNNGIGLFDIETWTFTLADGSTVNKQVLAAKKYKDR